MVHRGWQIIGAIFHCGAFCPEKKTFSDSKSMIFFNTLLKLFKKGSVYSNSTTFIFKMGPMVSFASALTVLMFLPIAGNTPIVSFHGDVIFVFYLLGLGRFFTIAAALDTATASPFEGMGAAREAYFPIYRVASKV